MKRPYPCPFCGAEAWLSHDGDFVCVEAHHADDCYLAGDVLSYYMGEYDALSAWNGRHARTCRLVPFVEDDGSVVVCNCSECDAVMLARAECNFCPNCGAKVVE